MNAEIPANMMLRASAAAFELLWMSGRISVCAALFIGILQGVMPPIIALLTKAILDGIGEGSLAPEGILALSVATGGAGLLLALTPLVSTHLQARLQRRTTMLVQERVYAATNRIEGLGPFENPRFLDNLTLTQQAAAVAPHQLNAALFTGVQSVFLSAGFAAVLWSVGPMILIFAVAAAIPPLFIQLRLGRRQAEVALATTQSVRRQALYQNLLTNHVAVKEVRLFGLGRFFESRLRDETASTLAAEHSVDRAEVRSQIPFVALGAIIVAAGLVWLATRASAGEASVGDIAAYVVAAAGLQSGAVGLWSAARRGREALSLLGHYLNAVSPAADISKSSNPRTLTPLERGITFDDVWFRYGRGPWILRGISFTIPAGASVAMVGLNGAGKSTLVKLICRLYDPSRGAILWDGVDIREFSVVELRERMSAIFQDFMAYELTARENIGIGDILRMGNLDDIRAAATSANIDPDLAALPHGYETLLSRTFVQEQDGDGEISGVHLSGGQWQRVALSRFLFRSVRDRDLLILDEPSAGLDASAEQHLRRQLTVTRGRSASLLISHQLSSVRRADQIVVIDEGRVVEQGTHAELMDPGHGRYRTLFDLQAAGYLSEAHE